MLKRSVWSLYSKGAKKIIREKFHGLLSLQERTGSLLVVGKGGSSLQGTFVHLFFVFSEKNGRVEKCSYSLFGNERLLLLCETGCSFCLNKTYRQLQLLTNEMLLQQCQKVFGIIVAIELNKYINLFLDAVNHACECCSHLPSEPITPFLSLNRESQIIENWDKRPLQECLLILEEVIQKEVRPFLILDSGNIQIVSLDTPFLLKIAYEGACVGCLSAYGATFSAIQSILKQKIHPSLEVTIVEEVGPSSSPSLLPSE